MRRRTQGRERVCVRESEAKRVYVCERESGHASHDARERERDNLSVCVCV